MTGQDNTSVVVVHAADFLDALRCAVIFTDQHAYPGVRVDINPDEECVEVSARVLNHVTATTAGVEWSNIVDDERDLAFELTIKQVRDVLQVFKNFAKRPADEEEQAPQIGIHLSEAEIRWFDETGLGLSVYLYGCARSQLDIPCLFHTIDTTMSDVCAEMPVHLSPDQLRDLTRVAKIMGTTPTIVGIAPDEASHLHRHIVLCDRFRSIASVPIGATGAESEELEELTFADAVVEEAETAVGTLTTSQKHQLRVVVSNPTGGIA
ncbi:hypothetical protein [Corynebacterium lipophiloflavum]|uniref:Uncharacterized protein n=1 Tax=Corynebacterium lipophiloflavum (strain ATCC 700352 / DSM 44291 / CCUG 37336 / JCM 10383 / DMMZ 1944) TaxID=525263 RepID=C0XTZ8_CORLD|nr:hypothetical protein [Corynebacterium lipophiloflavum]EEI16332.1 hypothetical protein HMPREF0298_1918 [Corynebacterium lipophiloflavum DSM 44291]